MQVLDVTCGNKDIICVYEYCDRGTLKDYILEEKRMEEVDVLRIFIKIALGVDFMHYKHVISKNLSSEHIYVKTANEGMRFKIGSFSNSTVVKQTLALTKCHGYDLRYQAPEIQGVFDDDKFNNRADVYALGVILYEMCSKKVTGSIDIDEVCQDVKDLGYSDEMVEILEMLLEPAGDNRKSIMEIIRAVPTLLKSM